MLNPQLLRVIRYIRSAVHEIIVVQTLSQGFLLAYKLYKVLQAFLHLIIFYINFTNSY